jgi:hypothetical protein
VIAIRRSALLKYKLKALKAKLWKKEIQTLAKLTFDSLADLISCEAIDSVGDFSTKLLLILTTMSPSKSFILPNSLFKSLKTKNKPIYATD